MNVTVQYFAVLREQAGRREESVDTDASTAAELYRELAAARGLTLEADLIKVAINDRFSPPDTALANGDRVVFLPPVSGG